MLSVRSSGQQNTSNAWVVVVLYISVVAGQWSRRHRDSGLSRQYIADSGPREGSVSRQVLV